MEPQDDENSPADPNEKELQQSNYDLFVVVLTLLALLALVITIIPGVSQPVRVIAGRVDNLISLIFLGDFFRSLIRAPDKLAYLRWGWLDLLGSIPAWPALRPLRLRRFVQAVQVLRKTRARRLWQTSTENSAESSLLATILVVLTLFGLSSSLILWFESGSTEATITTAEEAMWWTMVTVTTVGYGDVVPVTSSGRLMAMVLMTAGIGLYGVLASYLSSVFIGAGRAKEDRDLAELRTELAEVKQLLQEISRRIPPQEA